MATPNIPKNADQAEPKPEKIGYAEAMDELKRILVDLEAENPDVDVLVAQVERASLLVEICRHRISDARLKIEKVVATLDSTASD